MADPAQALLAGFSQGFGAGLNVVRSFEATREKMKQREYEKITQETMGVVQEEYAKHDEIISGLQKEGEDLELRIANGEELDAEKSTRSLRFRLNRAVADKGRAMQPLLMQIAAQADDSGNQGLSQWGLQQSGQLLEQINGYEEQMHELEMQELQEEEREEAFAQQEKMETIAQAGRTELQRMVQTGQVSIEEIRQSGRRDLQSFELDARERSQQSEHERALDRMGFQFTMEERSKVTDQQRKMQEPAYQMQVLGDQLQMFSALDAAGLNAEAIFSDKGIDLGFDVSMLRDQYRSMTDEVKAEAKEMDSIISEQTALPPEEQDRDLLRRAQERRKVIVGLMNQERANDLKRKKYLATTDWTGQTVDSIIGATETGMVGLAAAATFPQRVTRRAIGTAFGMTDDDRPTPEGWRAQQEQAELYRSGGERNF